MYFRVSHQSLYRYDVQVRLAPHVLRLNPRPGQVRALSQRLYVEPEPASRSQAMDAAGNVATHVSFGGHTSSLRIDSQFELETLLPPPLENLAAQLPLLGLTPQLRCHLQVQSFALELATAVSFRPLGFLDHLTQTLCSRMDRYVRHEGPARAAHETLALGGGACRDLTVLFLDACQALGLQGRFVSGYQAQAQTPDGQRHLHAWAEVWLPGIGYRGWDPMHGVRVMDGHVALYAAPTQAETMPIEGGFYFDGASVTSTLDHSVRIATS